jgi:hypothetical protein
MKILKISAKCSDLFWAGFGAKEFCGCVPTWLPNKNTNHYGDYVQLDIDVETGKIVNWVKPTAKQLEETFG